MMNANLKRLCALLLFAVMLVAALPSVAEGDLSVTPGLSEDWFNFLLIGTDTRKDEDNAGRSDTIIICSVNQQEGRVKLTSLARDMWVAYAGRGSEGKINAAIRYGGPELLLKTINETFSMNLEHYVSINFFGLMDIVDALGGVTLEISSAEAGQINQRIQQEFRDRGIARVRGGQVTLNGVQALCFARIRNIDSDLMRTGRQRRLLGAMLTKVKDCSMPQLLAFVDTCLDHCVTDLGVLQIGSMAMGVLGKGLDGFEELALPSPGNYRHATWDGISRVEYDPQQVTQELHSFIYEN